MFSMKSEPEILAVPPLLPRILTSIAPPMDGCFEHLDAQPCLADLASELRTLLDDFEGSLNRRPDDLAAGLQRASTLYWEWVKRIAALLPSRKWMARAEEESALLRRNSARDSRFDPVLRSLDYARTEVVYNYCGSKEGFFFRVSATEHVWTYPEVRDVAAERADLFAAVHVWDRIDRGDSRCDPRMLRLGAQLYELCLFGNWWAY